MKLQVKLGVSSEQSWIALSPVKLEIKLLTAGLIEASYEASGFVLLAKLALF